MFVYEIAFDGQTSLHLPHLIHSVWLQFTDGSTAISQTFAQALQLLHFDLSQDIWTTETLFMIPKNAPRGHKYLQKGLAIMMLVSIMIAKMQNFHANLLPNTENNVVSENASNIPASVPDGQRYLQNTGVSLHIIGRMITITMRMIYFSFLRIISPLNVLIFFGNGILCSRSWTNPNGHRNPQTILPSIAPKKSRSPRT